MHKGAQQPERGTKKDKRQQDRPYIPLRRTYRDVAPPVPSGKPLLQFRQEHSKNRKRMIIMHKLKTYSTSKMTNPPPYRCLAGFSIMAVCQCLYPITNLCQGTSFEGTLEPEERSKRKKDARICKLAMTKSCCFEVLDIPSLSRVLLDSRASIIISRVYSQPEP